MAARDLASTSRTDAATGLAARYRSLFVIGRGGMGAVEAALELHTNASEAATADERPHEAPYERVVALKRLLPDAARDKRRVEMFLREAKLAKLLDHPNVVRAFDYGEIDGELFLAMEYVEGQALSRVLKVLGDGKGELGATLTAHVLAEVCEGLHAAHELRDEAGLALNLVHRDVSPQNVMLGYDGHVRLLDFGVAKIEAESVTKTGEVKGKAAYMSPEQAMGDALDRRSDLFGVGAVLFECLALRRMWGDGTDMDVIRKLALEKPPRLEDAVASAPDALCALYMRLVAREAVARPATAHDVAVELRKLVPNGAEDARRALRRLLETHFAEQAAEQRRRLTCSLEEVAPEQARELRESVAPAPEAEPEPQPAPSTRALPRAGSSTASIADATGENAVSNGSIDGGEGTGARGGAGVAGIAGPTARESGPWPWLFAAALLLGGVAVWRATSGDGAGARTAPLSEPSAITPARTPAPPTATAAPPPTTAATTTTATTATATASAAAATSASARGPAATNARAAGAASSRAQATTTTTTTTTTTKASVAPAPPNASTSTPKPPPDVDDHPF